MKILLTNDDGWDAPGLQILKEVVLEMGDVWILAPDGPMSGISHQITLAQPLKLVEQSRQVYSLSGTPADCVRIAMTQLDVEFDWILSGINNGSNLGTDIYVSGTFAATREAAIRGCRSIALSQYRRKFKAEFDWTQTRQMAQHVLTQYLTDGSEFPLGTAINVNFPDKHHLPDGQANNSEELQVIDCEVDHSPLPADYRIDEEGQFVYCSKYDQRLRVSGKDVDVCFSGNVSVSHMKFC